MFDLAPEFEKPLLRIEKKIKQLEMEPEKNIKQIAGLRKKLLKMRKKIFSNLTPFQKVQIARHPLRPLFSDYAADIFTDFIELHGDRYFSDDPAIIAGFARLNFSEKNLGWLKCAVIGQEKGKTTTEKMRRNFGMAHPEGYRKALRIMKLAEKFNVPIITFIDTPGAYPGIGAEERGQSRAIAQNLQEMMSLKVPIVSVIIGEGGSGGALALGVSNYILILSNAIYSVISPEGCASILFRDATHAEKAANALKLTAQDLFKFGIVDEIVPEPLGGAHLDPKKQAKLLKKRLLKAIEIVTEKKDYSQRRYEKFRKMGVLKEG